MTFANRYLIQIDRALASLMVSFVSLFFAGQCTFQSLTGYGISRQVTGFSGLFILCFTLLGCMLLFIWFFTKSTAAEPVITPKIQSLIPPYKTPREQVSFNTCLPAETRPGSGNY